MTQTKVVLIGAGSASFGAGTLNSLLACDELCDNTHLTLTLVDTDPAVLATMLAYAKAVRAFRRAGVQLDATTDRRQALSGANFVITCVSVRRYELWQQDFFIPLAYGFRQPYGECGGPGAAFHTLRSLKLVVPIAQDMEQLCPEAWLLNFTNPESRVCLGVTMLTGIRTIGLCHGFHSTYQVAAEALGRPAESLQLDIGGINHFHWVLGIKDRLTGEDLLSEFDRRMKQRDVALEPLTRFLYETTGHLPFPSASHLAEFVQFGYEYLGPHYLAFQRHIAATSTGRHAHAESVRAVAEGRLAVTEEVAAPSGELAAPIIADMVLDRKMRRPSVNVPNSGKVVSNLPADCVVEVPAVVDSGGVHPVTVGDLPDVVAGWCGLQIAIQRLLVEAYRRASKEELLQALLLEPMVDDTKRAQGMMEEMLKTQAEWLPELR